MTPEFERKLRGALGRGEGTSDYDLNPALEPASERRLRGAAVLVAIADAPGGPVVLFTRRSAALVHHPGQIAFPGGKIDAGDAGPEAAALREAHEEIGLEPGNVEVWGRLPMHETVTGFAVCPVLGRVRDAFPWRPERGEVDEIFAVPLSHVTDPAMFTVQWREWRGSVRRYYAVPWGPYYIWGATARMLRCLAERMDR
ncbi:CoA pyrophosphatase [Roseitranquillus sediminis]|uniref:CoA pyrophosphatase n=1 Tax=Roseitranquillus sediminis TaxID=2809051 RepID=UPI001D0C63F4|nr:CoA pyrophosphatase [Roseitranquillus sediminis]MBM9593815.1 CoA pyrophosphatase [Roseitranquillus sediminis]